MYKKDSSVEMMIEIYKVHTQEAYDLMARRDTVNSIFITLHIFCYRCRIMIYGYYSII